jgi:hypothetical protein
MHVIKGTYRGQTEDIDESESFEDAKRLLREYRLAFGSEWSLRLVSRRVKKQKVTPLNEATVSYLEQANKNIADSAKRKQARGISLCVNLL